MTCDEVPTFESLAGRPLEELEYEWRRSVHLFSDSRLNSFLGMVGDLDAR
jgi:hypothetical protein